MGKRSIVDYVLSLDAAGHKRLKRKLDAYDRHNKRYTWEGFVELHFDRTSLWGWFNTIFAILGTTVGLAYGLWDSISNWRGFIWLLLETGFTTLVGLIIGTFAAALLVGVAIIAILGGIIWLIVKLVSLF
ncbi:MAG: hypothetical protein HKN70_14525 [Gammaproteobacteria bacterium]|nr:hypothetical protein [Gammaproteobacteria bacterium]